MFAQYEEANFEEFVDFLHQGYARVAARGVEGNKEAFPLERKSHHALKAAVAVFIKRTTIKPDHLLALQERLEAMGINEETVARYCLQVEGLRIASSYGRAVPLLDRRAPSDPALGLWWNDVRSATEAWDYDPTYEDRDAVHDELPLNEEQAAAIQAEVFGTRVAALELS